MINQPKLIDDDVYPYARFLNVNRAIQPQNRLIDLQNNTSQNNQFEHLIKIKELQIQMLNKAINSLQTENLLQNQQVEDNTKLIINLNSQIKDIQIKRDQELKEFTNIQNEYLQLKKNHLIKMEEHQLGHEKDKYKLIQELIQQQSLKDEVEMNYNQLRQLNTELLHEKERYQKEIKDLMEAERINQIRQANFQDELDKLKNLNQHLLIDKDDYLKELTQNRLLMAKLQEQQSYHIENINRIQKLNEDLLKDKDGYMNEVNHYRQQQFYIYGAYKYVQYLLFQNLTIPDQCQSCFTLIKRAQILP